LTKPELKDKEYMSQPSTRELKTKEEVLELVLQIESKISVDPTQAPPFLLLAQDLGVCPQSLNDEDATWLMNLQAQCEKYSSSPQNPIWTKNSNTIIESFSAIEAGLNIATRYSMREAEEKVKNPKTYKIGKK
jgi:hypothetical protein